MSDNTCSICLETLLQRSSSDESVGAVIPCGHCFHSNCFALWKASKGSNCKCPNCNKPAKQCIKIFISAPEGLLLGKSDNDDDTLSLQSTETTSERNEGQEDRGPDESTILQEALVLNDDGENSVQFLEGNHVAPTRNVPEIVDLTQDTIQRTRELRKLSSECTDNSERYKVIAKRYKRRFQQKDSQFREQYQHHHALLQNYNTMKEDLARINGELESRNELDEEFTARLDGAKLQIVRLERDARDAASRIKTLEKETKEWEIKYSRLEKSCKQAVQKAKNSDMAEVQQLLDERPKILAENQRLTRELASATQQLHQLQRLIQHNHKSVPSKSANSDSQVTKKRKISDVARDLRAMDSVRFPNEPMLAPEDSEQSTKGKMPPATGSRMQIYLDQQRNKASSSSNNRGVGVLIDNVKLRKNSISLDASQSLSAQNPRSRIMETSPNNSFRRISMQTSSLVASRGTECATMTSVYPRNQLQPITIKPEQQDSIRETSRRSTNSSGPVPSERITAINLNMLKKTATSRPSHLFSRCSKKKDLQFTS